MGLRSNNTTTREDFEEEVLLVSSAESDGSDRKWGTLDPGKRYASKEITITDYSSKTGKWEDYKQTVYYEIKTDNPDIETAQGTVDSEVNDIAYNSVTGTLNYIATPKTIKIGVGDTINLQGLGKYLSGEYYVKEVTRNISSSGYSHSCKVSKADMLVNLKSAGDNTSKEGENVPVNSSGVPYDGSGALVKMYWVKAGDTPYTIAKHYYGDGNMYYKLFDFKTQTRLDVTTQLAVNQQIQVT